MEIILRNLEHGADAYKKVAYTDAIHNGPQAIRTIIQINNF